MKRKVLILFILFLLVSTKDLEASTYSNYLPAGKNYIEEANLIINNDTLSTIDDIYVKSNTTYTLSFIGEALIEYPEIHLSSRNNTIYSDLVEDIQSCSMDMSNTICTFTTGTNDNYLDISISGEGLSRFYDYYGLDTFQLEEGSVMTDFEVYEHPFIDANSPEFNGAGAFITSYDDNYTLEQIINSHIVVVDDIDGNITNQIEVVSDNYSLSRNIVGEYVVELKATDSSSNSAYFTLTIIVNCTNN